MNTRNFFKKATLVLATVAAGLVASTAAVSAIPYDEARTNSSPVPAFNVFTGVPSVGNEADFLRSRETKVANAPYVDPLNATCAKGEKIQMRVYIHNGASAEGNNNGTGPSVAKDVRVKVAVPEVAGTNFTPSATISASNAATVNDTATINCNGKKVKLNYVEGSASSFSKATGAVALSDAITTTGVPVRSHATEGVVYGCWDQRVYVILTVQVEEVVEPVEEPKPIISAACDLFRITAGENRSVRVSDFKFTAKNATFKNAVINWDAGKTNTKSAVITDANKVVGQTYTYKENGTYLVNVAVAFTTHDNKEIVAGVENCQQQVTFTNSDTPPVVTPTAPTPAKPVTLAAAGPASMIATFAATAVAGTVLYRLYLSRRLV